MRKEKYILDENHNLIPVDLMTWVKWFETADRKVAKTQISKGVVVSTVFLGIDYNFTGERPLLFETMVFGGENDGATDRYSTWDEAVKGHEAMVAIQKGE